MHLNKNHTFSRRALAMLLTLALCFSLVPSAFAAQQNSYHDRRTLDAGVQPHE